MRYWLSCSLFFTSMSWAEELPLNMTEGVTHISHRVYDLHMTILLICCVIGILVFGVMFYAMLNHRKSQGAVAATFHESTKVEIIWTLIPFLILIGMAIPATKTLIAMEDPSEADMTILVTGSQWKWHYKYLEEDIEFYSVLATPTDEIANQAPKSPNYLLEVDKPLVLPLHQKIRFLMTSDDVIHSWWVPDFAVKKDANPGFINEAWTKIDKAGTYRGQCAELCGKDHGFMPVVVKALPKAEYQAWLASHKQADAAAAEEAQAALDITLSQAELMTLGEKVYTSYCAACHQPNGAGLAGVFPSLLKSPAIEGKIEQHLKIVVQGVSGTAMPAFGKQLSQQEIAAVVTYERNAWGNDRGDSLQAIDVNQFMEGAQQ